MIYFILNNNLYESYTSNLHICYLIFSFMCILCRSLFVLLSFFLFAIVLYVLLRYTDSDYPFGIFKLFLIVIFDYVFSDYNKIRRNILCFFFSEYSNLGLSYLSFVQPYEIPVRWSVNDMGVHEWICHQFDQSDEVRLSLYTMDIECLSSIYRQTKLPLWIWLTVSNQNIKT